MKNIEECTKLFQIEIPYDLVQATQDEVYREITKIAKIPGFRIGYAPRDMVEKHYSKDAQDEILKRLVSDGYRKAVEIHKVIPIGPPRLFNINFDIEKPLTFEAEVEIRPNIRLKKYKGIKIKKKRLSVLQNEIEEGLLRLRNIYAKYNDVSRPVTKGDFAVCDVEAFVDGKPMTKKNKDMWVLAEKEASILGIGEELIGLAKGHEKEIETVLPENFPDERYRAKRAKFKVFVNEVKERTLPLLDDAFAKELSAEDLEALKKRIESELFRRKEGALKIDMENQILESLLEDNRFSPPERLIARQKEVLDKNLEMELLEKGWHKDEITKKIKELDSKLREDAKDKVQLYFLLESIASKENIAVSDKDMDEKLKSIAISLGQSMEEVKKFYEKENLLEGLSEEVREEKVLEYLLREAEVTEVNDKFLKRFQA